VVALTAGALVGCQIDPITGQQQFNMFTVQDDIRFGQDAMKQFLDLSQQQSWYPGDPEMQAKCEEILHRITRVSHMPDLPWTIYYTECPDVNAFCLPGGQIMIFAGIWKMVEDDNELAAVIAHEVTHATARHGTERMTTVMAMQAVALAAQIGAAASGGQGAAQAADALNQMIQVLVPAYSRDQENEADHWGMIYMSKAGYDPNAAVTLWERAAQTDSTPFDIYSDHPSHADRYAALTALLPEAEDYYGRALNGEDFAAAAGPAWGNQTQDKNPYEVAELPVQIPQETADSLRFHDGVLDASNYLIDYDRGAVTVVVANRTGRNIKGFVLNITFYDTDGNIITTDRSKQKRRLNNGEEVQLSFTLPEGTTDAAFDTTDIKWD
jgi:predicted Zn-dependent protease